MPSSGYVADTFVAGEQPTTAKWNELWGNDASFNSGAGFNDGIIVTRHMADSSITASRLAAIESTDLFNGTTLTSSTWTDFKANQNFTVANANSTILISILGRATMGISGGGGVGNVASRIIIDSAGTPITRYIGGAGATNVASEYANPFSGSSMIAVTGLSVGTHTVKTQVYADFANCLLYFRASTLPNTEFFATYVVELMK